MRHLLIDIIPIVSLLAVAALFAASRFVPQLLKTYKQLCVMTLLFAASNLAGNSWFFESQSGSDTTMQASAVAHDRLAEIGQWGGLILGLVIALSIREKHLTSKAAANSFALLLLSVAGMLLASMAHDLATLVVALELSWLPAVLLPFVQSPSNEVKESVTKQVFIGLISTLFLLLGFAFLYGIAGSIDFSTIATRLHRSDTVTDPLLMAGGQSLIGIAATALILIGLGIRIPIVPFHFGFAEIQAATPTRCAALRVAVASGSTWIVLLRMPTLLVGMERVGQILILVLAIVTLSISIQGMLNENKLRRFLASVVLGQMGWALMAVSVIFWENANAASATVKSTLLTHNSTASVTFFMMTTLLSVAGIYALLAYLENEKQPIEFLEEFAGLIYYKPICALAGTVLLLSLCGVPPLAGFWSKLFLLYSALSVQGETSQTAIASLSPAFAAVALLAIVQSMVCVAVILRTVSAFLFSTPKATPQSDGGNSARWAALLLAVVLLATGLYPAPVLRVLKGKSANRSIVEVSQDRSVDSKKAKPVASHSRPLQTQSP